MNSIRHLKTTDLPAKHKAEHEGYEYLRRDFVRRGETNGTQVSIYEIPPQKSAYPYHYHLKDEETFFILSGEGLLKTPEGERTVHAGELLFFPTGSAGAHKLTNPSPDRKTHLPPLDRCASLAYNGHDRLEKVHPSVLFFDKVPVYL